MPCKFLLEGKHLAEDVHDRHPGDPHLGVDVLPYGGEHLVPGLQGVLVRGFDLSYHNKETMLFTIDPHYGNKKLL